MVVRNWLKSWTFLCSGKSPLIQSICECGDGGEPIATQRDSLMGIYFRTLARNVVEQIERRNAEQAPTQRVELQK